MLDWLPVANVANMDNNTAGSTGMLCGITCGAAGLPLVMKAWSIGHGELRLSCLIRCHTYPMSRSRWRHYGGILKPYACPPGSRADTSRSVTDLLFIRWTRSEQACAGGKSVWDICVQAGLLCR